MTYANLSGNDDVMAISRAVMAKNKEVHEVLAK